MQVELVLKVVRELYEVNLNGPIGYPYHFLWPIKGQDWKNNAEKYMITLQQG